MLELWKKKEMYDTNILVSPFEGMYDAFLWVQEVLTSPSSFTFDSLSLQFLVFAIHVVGEIVGV